MKKNKFSLLIIFLLCFSILTITVGFSAMSSTLTINGKLAFRVVKSIRISSITLDNSSTGVENSSANYGTNEIMGNFTLNTLSDNLKYNIVINNVGNVDQILTEINDVTFTNSNMDYTLTNLALNQTIGAGNTLSFTINFHYKNSVMVLPANKAIAFKIYFKFAEATLSNELAVGDAVNYLGKNWHIIATDSNTTTLFANSGEFSAMAHCLSGSTSNTYCYWVSKTSSVKYKWSKSQVNYYLNNTWLNSVDSSALHTSSICDDEYTGSGGILSGQTGTCTNGYVSSYVRLLTKVEYNALKTSLSDTSFLYGTSIGNYWLLNTGTVNFAINNINSAGTLNLNSNGSLNADHSVAIRPVITVTTSILKNAIGSVTQINLSSRTSTINANGTTYVPLGINETNQLNAAIVPSAANVTLTWSSSDENVVTVNQSGLVTGVGTGTATITCSHGSTNGTMIYNVAPLYNSSTTYSPGDYVLYEKNIFNVVSDDGTYLKLLGNSDIIGSIYSCYNTVSSSYCYWTSSTSYVDYKWSLSYANNYLNNTWLPGTSISQSNLQTSSICDADFNGTNGGKLASEGTCSTDTVNSYVRLLTSTEYNTLQTAANASTWLYSSSIGAWRLSNVGDARMRVYYVNSTGTVTNSDGDYNADHKMIIRPVITIIK
jgi:hypothetical protein